MFRPMRRHAQALERTECLQILAEEPRGVLSVLGDDGYPYSVPLNFVLDGDAILFHCAVEGHKLDAIDACDKASFCVMDKGKKNPGEWWWCFRSVIAFGRVRRVENDDEVVKALYRLAEKYFPESYDTQGDIDRNLRRVVILRLEIEHLSGKAVREK